MKQFASPVVANERIAEGYFRMSFPWEAEKPLPGQFFTVHIGARTPSILRRPFALSAWEPPARGASAGTASMIYQVRGPVTEALAALAPGAIVDLLGPLGNSFPLPDKGLRPVVVAGGIGLGPMLFLEASLQAAGLDPLFVYGCRRASFVPPGLPKTALVCTDDGSAGFEGYPAALFDSRPELLRNAALYACGPDPFLRSLSALAARAGIRCWVSVEQMMACGVGACAGCAVRKRDGAGYFKACSKGPVFDAAEVDL